MSTQRYIQLNAPYAVAYGDRPGVNKIEFMDNANGWHYTFMLNDFKKIFDIHKTTSSAHIGLLQVSYRDCRKLLICLSKYENDIKREFSQFISIVSKTKLARLDVLLIPLPNERKTSIFIKRRGKRFSVRREISVEDCEGLFISIGDVGETDCIFFEVVTYERKRPIGTLFKTEKQNEFMFISLERQVRFAKFMHALLIDVINQTSVKSKTTLLRLFETYQP